MRAMIRGLYSRVDLEGVVLVPTSEVVILM